MIIRSALIEFIPVLTRSPGVKAKHVIVPNNCRLPAADDVHVEARNADNLTFVNIIRIDAIIAWPGILEQAHVGNNLCIVSGIEHFTEIVRWVVLFR